MKNIDSIVVNMYVNSRLSASSIASELHLGRDRVLGILKRNSVQLRTRSEQAYIQHNNGVVPYAISDPKNNYDFMLMGLGIGIYWGEGNKVNEYSVRVGNTDPDLILMFVKYLIEICGVHQHKITYSLQVFNDTDPDVALDYWMGKLGCTRDKIMPSVVITPPQGKGSYRKKSKYGVMTVYYNSKQLKQYIMGEIESIKKLTMPK